MPASCLKKTLLACAIAGLPVLALADTPSSNCSKKTTHASSVVYSFTANLATLNAGEWMQKKQAFLEQLAQKSHVHGFKVTNTSFSLDNSSEKGSKKSKIANITVAYELEYEPNYDFITVLTRETGADNLVFNVDTDSASDCKSGANPS